MSVMLVRREEAADQSGRTDYVNHLGGPQPFVDALFRHPGNLFTELPYP